jgi:hypothetical protein
MKLENQVTDVETSNRMHELGFTEPSIFYRDWTGAKEDEILQWEKPSYCPDNVNCYTVAELGEMLPEGFITQKAGRQWDCYGARIYWDEVNSGDEKARAMEFFADTEANARAKMLIYLKEQKLI